MNNEKIKIVFMGTPDFSVKTLDKLYNDDNIEVMFVVTKVDTKSSRGQKINFSEVKKYAIEHSIKYFQPVKIKDDKELINEINMANPDFIIVVAFGQILSKEILDIPRFGCINGHASLLPKYRGASPIQSMILNGDKITGTSTMLMSEGLDSGDILEQHSFQMDLDETAGSLFEKLSDETANLVLHTIKNFKNIKPIKQNEADASYVKVIKKEDGLIDLQNESAEYIERKIRAYNPWPSAYIYLNDKMLKIYKAKVIDNIDENIKEIQENIFTTNTGMFMKTKDKYLQILELQPESKKRMSIQDYINGYKN